MRDAFNFDVVIDALADRLAGKLRTGGSRGEGGPAIRPRLLTVEQAATYLGRTKASVQHLISDGAIPVVRHDRRVFLDVRDLDRWIDSAKM